MEFGDVRLLMEAISAVILTNHARQEVFQLCQSGKLLVAFIYQITKTFCFQF